MARTPYKLPTIVRGNKYWHVAYFYEIPGQPGKFKKFQVKDGVNYIKDLDAREKEIQRLRDDVEYSLVKENFNPFEANNTVESQVFVEETEINSRNHAQEVGPWTVIHGCKEFIKYALWKKLSENSIKSYNAYSGALIEWLEKSGQENLLAHEFSEDDFMEFLAETSEARSWSARTYNNYVKFFPGMFGRIQRLEKAVRKKLSTPLLPAYLVDFSEVEKKISRAEKNKAYTGGIAEEVKNKLKQLPALENYVKWIYFSCMRPREIRHLQVKHIDIKSRQVKAVGPTAKTGDRFVPISDELMALIMEMGIDKARHDCYVFGEFGKISPKISGRSWYTEKYKSHIKDQLGLDYTYTLYGWKHTRVIDLLSSGRFNDYEVMSLTGHRDFEAFQAYKRDLVIDSSIMKGKTIGF